MNTDNTQAPPAECPVCGSVRADETWNFWLYECGLMVGKKTGEARPESCCRSAAVAAERRVAKLERELEKWCNWTPDKDTLREMAKQARSRDGSYSNGLAAQLVYIGGLSAHVRTLERELAECRARLAEAREIIEELYDDDPCSYDHHGYCQAHNWMNDDRCIMRRAADWLAPDASPPERSERGAGGDAP
jgi:hypothetical protein